MIGNSRSLPFEIENVISNYMILNKNGFYCGWNEYLWEIPYATISYTIPLIIKQNMMQDDKSRNDAQNIGERYDGKSVVKDALEQLKALKNTPKV